MRTRGTGGASSPGLLLPQDANRRGACAGAPAPLTGPGSSGGTRGPSPALWAAVGCVLAPLPDGTCTSHKLGSAKWH